LYNQSARTAARDKNQRGIPSFKKVKSMEDVVMKKYLACVAIATLLAGCSSAGTLRDSRPTAEYVSDGAVEAVAGCVSNAWSTKPVHVTTNELYSGTTVSIQQAEGGPFVALVDIKPVGATTIAKYYSQFTTDDTWYFTQVKNCMESTPPAS
jgi:uncharacterized protein YceK